MKPLYVIIVGCGGFGSGLANNLSSLGHSVVVIDIDENAFSRLNNNFSGFKIHGDANEFFILKQAKVEKADVVLTLTNDDNLNLMLAQIAGKIHHVKSVVACVKNPRLSHDQTDLGVKTVCPVLLGIDNLMSSIFSDGGRL